MKSKRKYLKILSIIIFVLSIGSLSWMVYGSEKKDIEYTIHEEVLKDETIVKLTLEITTSDKVEKINSITLPNQTVVENKTSITYEVIENGEYTFIVRYVVLEENESQEIIGVEKQEVIVYKENNIQAKEEKVSVESNLVEAIDSQENDIKTYAAGDIPITATYFPDANFRYYLQTNTSSDQIKGYGADGVLTVVELAGINYINVSSQRITNLKGLEYFSSLTVLACQDNLLTSLNISNNKNLIKVYCYNNALQSLDVRNNTSLTLLHCGMNKIKSLDTTNNIKLIELVCYDNDLGALNVSKNTALTTFQCGANNLTSIDVNNNKALTTFSCYDNKLSQINIRNNVNLIYFDCPNNQLTTLDISNNKALSTLICNNNQLLVLDLRQNTSLTSTNLAHQTREIAMGFRDRLWQSNSSINYGITSIDNANISYNVSTGQFSTRYASNSTSNFTTNCKDANGKVYQLKGTLSFDYQGFVPVTDITGIPSTMLFGSSLQLSGSISPSNATEWAIGWSIKNAGTTGATLTSNTLSATSTGTVVLTATIAGGTLSGPYTKDFTITIAYGNPTSLSCSYRGTAGKNGWYISDVTVHPPSGYQISKTLGSGYTGSLSFGASTTPIVYLKNSTTGALYSAKTLTSIKIDKVDPVISGIIDGGNSIDTGKTVTVQDVNLSSVMLYVSDSLSGLNSAVGTPQTISNGSSTVTLSAIAKNQYFRIEAEDLSGRKSIYTYTLIVPTYGVEVQDVNFKTVDEGYGSVAGIVLSININKGNTPATIQSIVSSDTSKFTVSQKGSQWIVTPVIGLTAGKHSVTLTTSYNGTSTTSTVSMIVLHSDPTILVTIPQSIELEKVYNNTSYEAIKEEQISITAAYTSLYPNNFYISTDPRFYLYNTKNADDYFMIKVYDEQQNEYTSKNNPLAILNSNKQTQKFYLRALKDIRRKTGDYRGVMTFVIGYGT